MGGASGLFSVHQQGDRDILQPAKGIFKGLPKQIETKIGKGIKQEPPQIPQIQYHPTELPYIYNTRERASYGSVCSHIQMLCQL